MKTQTKKRKRLTKALNYIKSSETLNKKDVVNKITSIGIEYYLARKYQNGDLTLRDYAELLNLNLWQAIDALNEFGIKGNTGAEEIVSSLSILKKIQEK